ncbi:hypothetical protein GOODEAATRI_007352, partial [Goodea atripinnis]
SPVSLLGDGRDCTDTPPPGCVDLSFLEEALLSSPEGGEDPEAVQPPVEAGCEAKKEEVGEEEVACDILQQSLQEAEITEQTMALEAGLAHAGDSLSLYSPTPLLSSPTVPFIPKSVTLPVAPTLPRDTQAAVEPPQPSLLAVGPGCPSLKPAAPAQLMGLLPGNVFPAPSPDNSFSLSPAQGSNMIIHKAVPSVTTRPLFNPALRAAAAPAPAPGIVLQRAPLPIQPKLPISIQPRLIQISPKPSGQKATSGLTFVPATASPNILLSQAPGQKTVSPQPQPAQQLSKPVSLQLVNQGGSFVLQPQGLFQGQNQFLLPGQCPVTISQPARAVQPLLTPSHQGPSVHSVAASTGQLVDGSQILTVPQRQLNFSPVFTTPTGQLALRQATVLSGSLQLQSAPATVFQMPAQLAGAYTAGGQGQQATLVHSPGLGNHITLINSSGVLPQDLTSISIVNGPSVVQGLPFAAQAAAPQAGVTEGQLSLQRASVVLLPERPVQEERSSSEEAFHQLQQPFGHVVQHVSVQPNSAGLQSSPPPVVAVLQPPPEPPHVSEPAVEMPKLLMPPADLSQVVEEVTHSMSQSQAFMQHMPQPLTSPVVSDREIQPQTSAVSELDAHVISGQCGEVSPHPSDLEDPLAICSPSLVHDTVKPAPTTYSPPPGPQTSASQSHMEAQVQYQVPHQHQVPQSFFAENQVNVQSSVSQPQSLSCTPAHSSPSPLHVNVSVPQQQTAPTTASAFLSKDGDGPAVQQHTQNNLVLSPRLMTNQLVSTAGESVGRNGDAGASFPPGREVLVSRGETAGSQRSSAQSSGFSHVYSSTSPSSPPAWARLTERPPGLKTYRSSSRGALRLTIKQESGSRKVIHNSACDSGLKRDHAGQLTNGGGGLNELHHQATNGASRRPRHGEEMSDGVFICNTAEQVPQTAPDSQTKPSISLPMTEPEDVCFEMATRDIGAPKLKCYRLDVSPQPEQRFSPASLPFQEDNILSEHLQSAIDSILELQRLQGPSAAPSRAASGPSLDQPVTSILEGHL